MSAIVLSSDLEERALAEVAAGRAESLEHVVAAAVRSYLGSLEAFRRSLDEAAAEIEAGHGVELDDAFDYVDARIEARAAFEEHWSKQTKRANQAKQA